MDHPDSILEDKKEEEKERDYISYISQYITIDIIFIFKVLLNSML